MEVLGASESPMRILFVLPAYEPAWSLGGIVRCMSNLCRALVAQGHTVAVYTINSDGLGNGVGVQLVCRSTSVGFKCTISRPPLALRVCGISRTLISHLRKSVRQFDIVYVSAVWQWLGRDTTAICKDASIPSVFGTHGSLIPRLLRRHGLRKRLYWHFVLLNALPESYGSTLHFWL